VITGDRMLRIGIYIAATLGLAILAVMQFFRPTRNNPLSDPAASFEAIVRPPESVAAPIRRACYDCHSNQTKWPWYSNVSPVSWVIAQDVIRGRAHLNLSEWDRYGEEMSRTSVTRMCDQVITGKMPLWYFQPFHPDARLTISDVTSLCDFARGGTAK
jgi:hypothetical protein